MKVDERDNIAPKTPVEFPYRGVLFVCRGNAVRSQMAEGLFRAMAPAGTEVWSAGTHPIGVLRDTIRAMQEIGIDISGHASKSVDEVPLERVDLLITLCGGIEDPCPSIRSDAERLHWPLPDPYMIAAAGTDALDGFRAVRDELQKKIADMLEERPPLENKVENRG